MGLESHITRVLQREKSGMVEGEDYWFEWGLTCPDKDTAIIIREILDDSGEFGKASLKRELNLNHPLISDRKYNWKINFGVY